MANHPHLPKGAHYQIQVLGRLGHDWSDWLDATSITYERGITTMTGPVADQAALRGILTRIWDANLTVIALRRIEAGDQG